MESVLLKLLQACNYDVSAAQRGIIYIDEVCAAAYHFFPSSFEPLCQSPPLQDRLWLMLGTEHPRNSMVVPVLT